MNVTNSFDQISLVLSIRGRICDFLPWAALPALTRAQLRKTNRAQCTVRDGLTYSLQCLQCEKQIVSLQGCNCIAKILKEKLNQWLLLLIISLLNLICCRTVAKLTSIMPMSSACYSLWIIVCCAITYMRQAYGTRVQRLTRIFHKLTLLTPDILPQFHAPSLITNWLIDWGCVSTQTDMPSCCNMFWNKFRK